MTQEPKDQSTPNPNQSMDQAGQQTQNPEVSNLTPDLQDVQGEEIDSPSPHSSDAEGKAEANRETMTEEERLSRDIKAFQGQLNELMSWKEDLKLYSLGANINLAYYDLWRSDANRLFQRCVILRKRLQKYARRQNVSQGKA